MAQLVISPNTLMNEFKIAVGEAALDGSNPTPLPVPFANIVAVLLQPRASVGSGTVSLTYQIAAGVLNVYGWVAAGTASTGTETFSYMVIGY